jgi:peptide deformylase
MIDSTLLYSKIEDIDFTKSNIIELATVEDRLVTDIITLGGIGLAANQIGLSYRAFAICINKSPIVLFNPKILNKSNSFMLVEEGCLSYPGVRRNKRRMENILVGWQNISGRKFERILMGMEAACFQHELDHLEGIRWKS